MMMNILKNIRESIELLIGHNKLLCGLTAISILIVFSSCRTFKHEKIGSIKDYKLSEIEIQEISYRLFIASEIDEHNMPLNNLQVVKIKSNNKLFFIVNWFNLNTEKYLVTYEWLDKNNRLLDQSTTVFKSESNSWITWHNKKMNKLIFPEGKIKVRVKLNNHILIEQEFEIDYFE